ncbi:MAG: hypothetical protein ACYDH3_13440 [Candidatus Aminicenantales bacterium]
MGKKRVCVHCGSTNIVTAGLGEMQEIDEKTRKPVGEKKPFYLYKCRDCLQYFHRLDIKDLVS